MAKGLQILAKVVWFRFQPRCREFRDESDRLRQVVPVALKLLFKGILSQGRQLCEIPRPLEHIS